MGFDWPASPLFFGVISLVLIGVLWVHARNLLKNAPAKIATRLVLLRIFSLALLLALLARPFLEQEDLDQSKFRLLTLVDFSGSMEVRDDRGGKKRNEQIRPYLESLSSESWLAKQRQRYGMTGISLKWVRKPLWVTLYPARLPRQKIRRMPRWDLWSFSRMAAIIRVAIFWRSAMNFGHGAYRLM
jgi:hypothetical protein